MLFLSKKRDIFPCGIFVLFFLALAAFLPAQSEADNANNPFAAPEGDSPPPRSMREDESRIPIPSEGGSAAALQGGAGSTSSFGAILRLIAALAVLSAACYLLFRFIRKASPASASDPFLKSTASLALGQGKSVSVVTLGSRAFLLGVSDHAVSLIAEITDAELIDSMNLQASMNPAAKKSFVEVLSEIIPKFRQEDDDAFSSSKDVSDFIRRRRSDLNDRERDGR